MSDNAQQRAAQRVSRGDGWEMRLGDCIEGMRDLADDSVDVTITDPPYEAEAHEKGKRVGPAFTGSDYASGKLLKPAKRIVDAEFSFVPITEQQRQEVSVSIARTTRKAALVFCQAEAAHLWRATLEAAGMTYRRTIPWCKPDAQPSLHGRWPGQSFEAIVLATRGAVRLPIGGKAVYYEFTTCRAPERAHETAKPLALMRKMVVDFTEPGDTVLDPFAGSGSTGVACRQLGRRFLGWELSPDYFEIACRRLRGDEAKPNPAQPSLF